MTTPASEEPASDRRDDGSGGRLLTRPFATLWVVGFCSYASVYLLLSVLPLYLHRWGLTDAIIGVLLGFMSAAAFLVRPFSGWLADARGRKPFVVAGVAGLFLSTVALPWAGSILPFALLRVVNGVGWGSLTSNANTLAGEMAPARRRGEALGLYTVAGSVALAAGPAVGLAIMGSAGFAPTFWIAALMAAIGTLAAVFVPAPAMARRRLPRPTPRTLLAREAAAPAAVLLLHATMYGGLISFLPLLAHQRDLGNPGLFFTVYAIALMVLRGVAGRLSDRFGRVPVIVPGLVCGSASLFILATSTNLVEMLVAALLFAGAMGLVQPPALAWGLDVAAPARRAVAMATMVLAQDLGIIVGSSVLGAVGTLGGYGALFGAGAVPGVVAAVGLIGARALGLVRHPQSGPEAR